MNFFSLWAETSSTLEKVILSLAIGFILAMFVMLIAKRNVGKVARELIKRGANSPETALTLKEMGIKPHGAATPKLRDPRSLLRRSVKAAPENEGDSPDRPLRGGEALTARYYVPEEERIAAEVRFDAKNTTWPIAVLGVIAIGIVAYLCIKYIPEILKFRLD